MKAQAVSEPQLRNTSSAPAEKVSISDDSFAAVLHQATEGVATVPVGAHISPEEQGALEETALAEGRNATLRPKQGRTSLDQSSASGRQVPTIDVTSGSPAHAVVVKADAESKSPDASEANAALLSNDPVECAQRAPDSASGLKESQVSRPCMEVNGADAPGSDIEKGKCSKPTIVGGESKSTKAGISGAKRPDAEFPVEVNGTTDVTNWSANNFLLDIAAGSTAPQILVVPQKEAIGLGESVPAADALPQAIGANKLVLPSRQIFVTPLTEVASEKKAGPKALNETMTIAKEGVAKDGSFDVPDDDAGPGAATGDATHNALVMGMIPSTQPASGGHPTESWIVAPASPVAHGLSLEAAGFLGTREVPSSVTAEGMLPHSMLSSTATSLEVGVASGTHGWLKIRAEMTGSGEVNASLTGGSSVAANRLRDDLPALNSYLQAEKVQVNGLNVHTVLPGSVAFSN